MTDVASNPIHQLADSLADTLFRADPFEGSEMGRTEYDALVPDASAGAEERLDGELAAIATQAASLTPGSPAEAVTLSVVTSTCDAKRRGLAMRPLEHTVTAMPIAGPPMLLAALARTVLPDAAAAQAYLARLRAAPTWVDQVTARLAEGAARGRYPVGALTDNALAWAERALQEPVPAAVTSATPPPGWDGAADWREDVAATARDQLVPAIGRWAQRLRELRPTARDDASAGISALPDGAEDYAAAIEVHTTLPFTAEQLHRVGLDEVARLTELAIELGAEIGLPGITEVREAARRSAGAGDPLEAMARAQDAVRRAEAVAGRMLPQPLPEPCAVTPMPVTVAEAGMAPHYTPPRLDGSRPGTYWFNTLRPTAGTGWELESVAFHEAVPGHHSQLAHAQGLRGLPVLQEIPVTVHAEGWGLYAERLAGEFDLYSDTRARIGAVYAEMMRATRLVLDTGLHALGWSRSKAVAYMTEHVALPEAFLANEIDRYIAWPGQALAYLVGQREILRLRASAASALGPAFDLPEFNRALLDSGSVPMPVLDGIVNRWVAAR